MSVFSYLTKINEGKPINMEAFRKALPDDVRENLYAYFYVEPYSAKLSRVQFMSTGMAEKLMNRFSPSSSRIDAAMKGDSHRHGVEACYLLMYQESGNGYAPYAPEVVVMAENRVYFNGHPFKSQALIVENEENFFHYRKMLEYASMCQEREISLNNTDVILAGGNRVTKAVTANWIGSTYSRVICALDYDPGGLLIYKSLLKAIPHAEFAQPSDWRAFEGFFRSSPVSSPVLCNAEQDARTLGFVGLADAFHNTRHFMEQETILSEEFTL